MKRLAYCALVLVVGLAAHPVNAQFGWHYIYPNVQGQALNDMDIMFPTSAVAVGVAGTVITTYDRGVTWQIRPAVPGRPSLNAVSAINWETFVVVGNGGLILRTTNSGWTWDTPSSGVTTDLLDVDFTGAWDGFAVGTDGTILRSTDAGVTWMPQTSGTSVVLRGVQLTDANTGYAVGSAGTILKTIDGGANWAAQISGTTADLFDVDFYGTEPGTVVGGYGAVLITVDGGAHWSPGSSSLPVQFHCVDMLAYPTIVAMGVLSAADGVAGWARSLDGGMTWTGSMDHPAAGLNAVGMFTSNEGIAVGVAGAIRRTTDTGANWPLIGGGSENYTMRTVRFFDALHGVAASGDAPSSTQTSRVYMTNDGGATWSVGVPFPAYVMNDFAYADANTIYMVGKGTYMYDIGGTIWRSVNGGPWEQIYTADCSPISGRCVRLQAIDFAGPGVGVAVGDGEGLVTILGGTPHFVPLPNYPALYGVSVPTVATAYAAGSGGSILKGDLVGGTWTELASGTTENLRDVAFVDDMHGWVVGDNGIILRTTDGGLSWEPQVSGTTGRLGSVAFLDAANGIIGTGSMILKSPNGGASWVPEDMGFPVADVDFVDPVCAVVAGSYETIMMHRDFPVPVLFQNVRASVDAGAVKLEWTLRDDGGVRGFDVYRSSADAGEFALTGGTLAGSTRSFVDRTVESGREYEYTVVAVSLDGTTIRSPSVRVSVAAVSMTLSQNHPNPFNPATQIRFTLPARAWITLSVFDVAGRRVATLADGEWAGGEHEVTWEGKDAAGRAVSSGVYFYELRTPDAVIARKMMLLK